MTFSLPSTSCLRKLPFVVVWTTSALDDTFPILSPYRWGADSNIIRLYLAHILHALHEHFKTVLVLSMTWYDRFCRCVDDVSIWRHFSNFVLLSLRRWFQFNSIILSTHFARIKTWNNREVTFSYIFQNITSLYYHKSFAIIPPCSCHTLLAKYPKNREF